jgi:2-aminoadipate transaminase
METISFARDTLAPEYLPTEELADCAATVLARDGRTILSYGSGAGYTPLRTLVGEWFGVHPGRVVLTNSSLQGLQMVARHLAPGRGVITEFPTYDRVNPMLLVAGASLMSITMDEEGMHMEDFETQLKGQQNPAFVYTIPTFQNPTGRTLSEPRRRRLAQVLRAREILLFEDDPYYLLRFEGEALPTLFDYTGQLGIYSSSFSPLIAPGLRVGWMILPDRLAEELTEVAASTYITPSQLGEAIVNEFIARGRFEPNLLRFRELLLARRDAMLAALEKHFSGALWTRPEGGYFIWLQLPGTDMREVLERAEGVTARAGSEFGAAASAVRLSFSFAEPDEIETGIERLAAAL